MKFSDRELTLALVTGAAVLIGATALVAKPYLVETRELRARQDAMRLELEEDRALAESKDRWVKEMDALKGMLVRFPAEQSVDSHFMSVIDKKADQNGVKIGGRTPREEKRVGDVFEMVIDYRDWEGSLDALVHFLFELQSEGAMFDVRQLTVKPKGKNLFGGAFSLSCAYIKEGAKVTSAPVSDGRRPGASTVR